MKNLSRTLHHLRVLFGHGRLRPEAAYPPLILRIEPTNHCNFRCVICAEHAGIEKARRPKGYMSMALYERLLDQAARTGVKEVYLYFNGESLLHPQFPAMLCQARERAFHVRLHTNASLLDDKMASLILEAGLDDLVFSVSGFDRESYEKIMVGGDYERTMTNIKRFLAIKRERGLRRPYVQMQMVKYALQDDSRRNYQEMCAALEGVDEVKFSEYMPLPGRPGEEAPSPTYYPCDQVWKQLTVCWDGKILPCCEDYNAAHVIGDAAQDDLSDVWNGKAMVALRRKLAAGEYASVPICRECRQPWHDPDRQKRQGRRLVQWAKRALRRLVYKPRWKLP